METGHDLTQVKYRDVGDASVLLPQPHREVSEIRISASVSVGDVPYASPGINAPVYSAYDIQLR